MTSATITGTGGLILSGGASGGNITSSTYLTFGGNATTPVANSFSGNLTVEGNTFLEVGNAVGSIAYDSDNFGSASNVVTLSGGGLASSGVGATVLGARSIVVAPEGGILNSNNST